MRTARGQLWHLPQLAMILWGFTRATPWLPQVRSHWDDLRALFKVIRWGWVRVIRKQGRVAGFVVRDGDILQPRARFMPGKALSRPRAAWVWAMTRGCRMS